MTKRASVFLFFFSSLALLVTGAVTGCATAPTRPALLDVPAGGPLVELPPLADAAAEAGLVDITLPTGAAPGFAVPVARARTGDAVVLRGLAGTFQEVGDERVAVDDGVALFNPQRPGAFALRAGRPGRSGPEAGNPRAGAILLVSDAPSRHERVLLLDDATQGIERLNGLGNKLVVNGQARPTVRVTPGSTERWHLFNVAERRLFLISLPGHLLTGLDGKTWGELSLAPGESASVDVMLGLPVGTAVDVTTIDADAAETTADAAEAWPLLRVLYVQTEKP